MGRMKELYETVEDLVYEAIERGANNTAEVHAIVAQNLPHSLVSYELIENIIREYDNLEYDADNVY